MDNDDSQENEKAPDHIVDIKRLSRTELGAKYRRAYSSWKNSKRRAKLSGGHWAPEFEDFTGFLAIMGPPGPNETLDRLNHENETYAPGLVEWTSKSRQANNRSTTRYVTYDDVILPVTEAARRDRLSPDKLHRQLRREQSIADPFETMLSSTNDPRSYQPWPQKSDDPDLLARWEAEWRRSGGLKNCHRYDFLIDKCINAISQLSNDLQVMKMIDAYDSEARWKDAVALRQKFEICLKRAERERPLWQRAVNLFEARRVERSVLRKGGYLRFSGDNEG